MAEASQGMDHCLLSGFLGTKIQKHTAPFQKQSLRISLTPLVHLCCTGF